ncbi:acyltransferase [Tatumella punctata]|uniref:Acyltransferase family protein n=1 Tax=Tatumella punctata TaxID=399969 RepID=A0ABW1VSJ0_9GAMM
MKTVSLKTHDSNCFDILRHLAAFLVIISHHFAFNGLQEPLLNPSTKLGSMSVLVFFSISGFLITQSKIRSRDNWTFIKKRTLRIMPGLICCAFFTTYIICGIFGRQGFTDWALSLQAFKTFLYYSLLGSHATDTMTNFFSTNFIFSRSVNSSLWTLLFEVIDYVMVLIFFSIFRNKILASLLFLSISIAAYVFQVKTGTSAYYLARFSSLSITFALGSLLLITIDLWKVNYWKIVILISGVALYILSLFNKSDAEWDIFTLTSVPLIVIPLGLSFKDRIIHGRFDISYGIYVYAFPIQQLYSNIAGLGFLSSLVFSILTVFILAISSWVFVEKSFLKRKKKPQMKTAEI